MYLKKETYRKLERLDYDELRMQKYLACKNLSFEEKKLVFKFRTRMVAFGENFRAGRDATICPLCQQHSDSQYDLLNCEIIKESISQSKILQEFNMKDVLTENIQRDMVKLLKLAMEIRKSKLEGTIQKIT